MNKPQNIQLRERVKRIMHSIESRLEDIGDMLRNLNSPYTWGNIADEAESIVDMANELSQMSEEQDVTDGKEKRLQSLLDGD